MGLLKLSKSQQEELLKQIEQEFKLAFDEYKEYSPIWKKRFELYIQQRKNFMLGLDSDDPERHKNLVHDNLLFSVHNTIFATLYEDEMVTKFYARTPSDVQKAETIQYLAEYDYDQMRKDKLDYDWLWYAMMFGKAVVVMKDWDTKKKLPKPYVINPTLFLKDPFASTVNGNVHGEGAARFLGRLFLTTYNRLLNDKSIKGWRSGSELYIRRPSEYGGDIDNIMDLLYLQLGAEKGNLKMALKNVEIGYNQEFLLLEWYTHWEGRKVSVITTPDFDRIFRVTELDDQTYWPFIERDFIPIPGKWYGVSIADLVEDKQQLRTVLYNLFLDFIALNVNRPIFVDQARIIDTDMLLNPELGGIVPVRGSPRGVVEPMPTPQLDITTSGWFMNLLDETAQRSTATPELRQGVPSRRRRTLGEINLLTMSTNTRYSLYAKVIGWSDKEFWNRWLSLYKKYFAQTDEKVVRIVGVDKVDWITIDKKVFGFKEDPDIAIRSKAMDDYERRMRLQEMAQIAGLLLGIPDANKKYIVRRMAQLAGFKDMELEFMLPPDRDEYIARLENKDLNRGKDVPVRPEDNDRIHLIEHSKAIQNEATAIHIAKHIVKLAGFVPTPAMENIQKSGYMDLIEQQVQQQGYALQQEPVQGMPPQGAIPTEAMPQEATQPEQLSENTPNDIIEESLEGLQGLMPQEPPSRLEQRFKKR